MDINYQPYKRKSKRIKEDTSQILIEPNEDLLKSISIPAELKEGKTHSSSLSNINPIATSISLKLKKHKSTADVESSNKLTQEKSLRVEDLKVKSQVSLVTEGTFGRRHWTALPNQNQKQKPFKPQETKDKPIIPSKMGRGISQEELKKAKEEYERKMKSRRL